LISKKRIYDDYCQHNISDKLNISKVQKASSVKVILPELTG